MGVQINKISVKILKALAIQPSRSRLLHQRFCDERSPDYCMRSPWHLYYYLRRFHKNGFIEKYNEGNKEINRLTKLGQWILSSPYLNKMIEKKIGIPLHQIKTNTLRVLDKDSVSQMSLHSLHRMACPNISLGQFGYHLNKMEKDGLIVWEKNRFQKITPFGQWIISSPSARKESFKERIEHLIRFPRKNLIVPKEAVIVSKKPVIVSKKPVDSTTKKRSKMRAINTFITEAQFEAINLLVKDGSYRTKAECIREAIKLFFQQRGKQPLENQ